MPQIQADRFPTDPERLKVTAARRDWVKRAFLHAWEGYKAKAFGHDETAPVSGKTRDGYNAWGATVIDALCAKLQFDNLAITDRRTAGTCCLL